MDRPFNLLAAQIRVSLYIFLLITPRLDVCHEKGSNDTDQRARHTTLVKVKKLACRAPLHALVRRHLLD